jgi:hypothetical protein
MGLALRERTKWELLLLERLERQRQRIARLDPSTTHGGGALLPNGGGREGGVSRKPTTHPMREILGCKGLSHPHDHPRGVRVSREPPPWEWDTKESHHYPNI